MRARSIEDPREFLALLLTLAGESEARHNLIFGITGRLVTSPDSYESHHIWVAEAGEVVTGAAVMTPPWNLVLTDEGEPGAAAALASVVHQSGLTVPGATGNRPAIDHFIAEWTNLTGSHLELTQSQGVFKLEAVRSVVTARGRTRRADPEDRELLLQWTRAFVDEAFTTHPPGIVTGMVDRQLRHTDSGVWLWEVDGNPVSLSAYGGRTPSGIRIGPVYTPPEHRGLGYATSLVAEQSSWLLGQGHHFCFLYTDLANATSNAIYQRIGYEQVAESAAYRFLPQDG